MKKLMAAAVAMTVLAAPPANAANMEVEIFKKSPIVYLTGPIVDNDYKKFYNLTAKYPPGKILVVLHSEGGNLLNGLDIGLMIRERRMDTVVYGQCISVCGYMWLAGVTRGVAADAGIGFHSAYTVKDDRPVTSGGGNALVGGYLVKLGLRWGTIHYLTNASPATVEWLNDEKAKELGIRFITLKAAGINKAANDTSNVVKEVPVATVPTPSVQRRLVATPLSGQCPDGTQLEPKIKRFCLLDEMVE